jgi:hypothetical protein
VSLSFVTSKYSPLNGDARSAVGARSSVAGAEIVASCPKIEKPLTRRSSRWKPWPPPNENRTVPLMPKISWYEPSNGTLTLSVE